MMVVALHQSMVGTKGTDMPTCPGGLMPMGFPCCFPRSQQAKRSPRSPKLMTGELLKNVFPPPGVQQHELKGCRALPSAFTSAPRVGPETRQPREVAVKSTAGTTSGSLRHSRLRRGQVKESCRHCSARVRMALGQGEV